MTHRVDSLDESYLESDLCVRPVDDVGGQERAEKHGSTNVPDWMGNMYV